MLVIEFFSAIISPSYYFQIRGFPTIKYFKSGEVEDYNGPRSAESIVEFGLQKAEMNRPPPEVNEITSNDVLHSACDDKQLCVIGFLPQLLDCQSKCRHDYLNVMKEAAKKHKGKDWGYVLRFCCSAYYRRRLYTPFSIVQMALDRCSNP